MKILALIRFFLSIHVANSFLFSIKPIAVTSYIRSFKSENISSLEDIKVTEPYFKNNRNTSAIVFFTGGNNLIIDDIYKNFLHNLVYNQFSVYSPSFRYSNTNLLAKQLYYEYKHVLVIGHSSGAVPAINFCSNNTYINKLVLLDGVNPNIFNQQEIFKIPKIKKVLLLNAEKSYKFNWRPFGIPFIPFFGIKKKNFNTSNGCIIQQIKAEDFGHSDLLDTYYSNLMHGLRLSVGNNNRTETNLHHYHSWLAQTINSFKYSRLD
jgi:hypothetical protein